MATLALVSLVHPDLVPHAHPHLPSGPFVSLGIVAALIVAGAGGLLWVSARWRRGGANS